MPGSFPITPYLGALLKAKFPSPVDVRKALLEAHQWTARELEERGLVDVLVEREADARSDGPELPAVTLAESKASLAITGVWGINRREMMRRVIQTSLQDRRVTFAAEDAIAAQSRL